MGQFQAVIFDMDGVVIDTKPGIEQFWQGLAAEYGFQISAEVMEDYIHGCPVWLSFEKVFPMMSTTQKEQWLENIHIFEADLTFEPLRGISNFLQSLFQHQIPVALVTSGYLKKVEKVFNQLEFNDYFQAIVTADMVKHGKPHPEPFLMAADKLKIPPNDCVVFEDSISGITAASKAGMHPIGINKLELELKLKKVGAHEIIPNFGGVEFKQVEKVKGINSDGQWLVNF